MLANTLIVFGIVIGVFLISVVLLKAMDLWDPRDDDDFFGGL